MRSCDLSYSHPVGGLPARKGSGSPPPPTGVEERLLGSSALKSPGGSAIRKKKLHGRGRGSEQGLSCLSTVGGRRWRRRPAAVLESNRYQVMFIFYLLFLQLQQTVLALHYYQRELKVSKDAMKEVFTSAEQANSFIGRHLLSNILEREIFNTDNLERECHEELCSYEEAREVFDDSEKMKAFWSEYVSRNSGAKPDGQEAQEIDVILLLTGLIAMGVLLVIIGFLIYYLCKRKCPRRQPPRHPGCRLHNSSIFRRHEEFSLNPLSPCPEHMGLPTYEQAVALRGDSDAPPPPYPGLSGRFKAFKKSLSLPGP